MNISQWKPRSQIALGLAAVLVLISAVAIGYIATRGDDDSGPANYMGAIISNPVEMPNLVLTDQDGKTFDLQKETEGVVSLVYVGYTHCPDICPTHLAEMNAALRDLPKDVAEKVKVIFITSDPERDTPEVLKKYLSAFNPSFIGLTGTREQTDAAQEALGVPVAEREDLGVGNYAVNHAAYVIAYTKDHVAHTVYPSGMGRKEWINDLPLLVKRGFVPS